jgi:DnaJ homolog subfamily C member 8
MSAPGCDDEEYDYKAHANILKDQGNERFQAGENDEAIRLYTQAIELDPDNHIFYSNRSAAHMKCDSKSKALYDAEKCVQLAPMWSKGYLRLGAAQQSLKRFDAAIDTLKKGIELDSSNQALWSALRACQEAYETDKKSKFAAAAVEREQEAERIRRMEEIKMKASTEKATEGTASELHDDDKDLMGFFSEIETAKSATSKDKPVDTSNFEEKCAPETGQDDDLLAGFFSDVLEQSQSAEKATRDESLLTEKYTTQDLGDSKSQYERIMAKNYEWRNLNPYYVLQLDIDATEEDIKQRYRKLSVKLHPDKMRDVEHARECFEQVLCE